MKVTRLAKYSPEIAQAARELLIELSRSGKDRGEIPRAWFEQVINSPYHDLILALDDSGTVLGMVTVSLIMGAGIRQNAYLEDFVVSAKAHGQGVGNLIWEEILNWGREHGAKNLEFTSGAGREAAQAFYTHRGAKIYDTNFFRKELA